jgi:hypothetical protein
MTVSQRKHLPSSDFKSDGGVRMIGVRGEEASDTFFFMPSLESSPSTVAHDVYIYIIQTKALVVSKGYH